MHAWQSPRALAVLALLILAILLLSNLRSPILLDHGLQQEHTGADRTKWPPTLPPVDETEAYWLQTSLSGSFEDQSIEIGQRAGILRDWIQSYDPYSKALHPQLHAESIEKAAVTLFPFLANTLRKSKSKNPMENIQPPFNKSSRGIVILTSVKTFRQTFHLLGALTEVVLTDLPIQIAYSGNDSLRSFQREMLAYRFPSISFLDISTLFVDNSLPLETSDSALKILAGLATTFEQFILLEANTVLLYRPDLLFKQSAYHRTGALLFGRPVQSPMRFPATYPPEVLTSHSSTEWTQGSDVKKTQYLQEKYWSVVVLDKSRVDVLIGLLHASWQTILNGHGRIDDTAPDREIDVWRLAFELTGSPHGLQTPSAAVIGWPRHGAEEEICSFADGYSEENGTLLWYTSLIVRKDEPSFGNDNVPTHRVVMLSSQEVLNGKDILCTVRENAKTLTHAQQQIIQKTAQKAQQLDSEFGLANMHKSLTSSDT
ncbi:hypothetical protein TruAng_009889 [Truncatella angustata]|nr:hypothetical protein TruAng_009889 [Truncatella angustata]